MSVQLPRERVMVIKPLLDWSCLLLQLWNMDPCCELKSQSKALINGKSSSSELSPAVTQVCGCSSSPRPGDPGAGMPVRAGEQPGAPGRGRLNPEHRFHIKQRLEQQDEFERVPQSFRRHLVPINSLPSSLQKP